MAEDKGPKIDPEKARQIQKGATESGWQPQRWADNLKQGLGYADGGTVDSSFIPDDQFKPDLPVSRAPAPSTAPSASDFIPDSAFVSDEETYGSAPQQIIAGLEAAASGASLGASRVLENELGITTPEAQKLRQEVNPITSTLGEIVGTGGLIYGTGGAGALVKGAPLAARLGAAAVEGGIIGGGQAVSDYAMGDPNLNAQKVLTHIGVGAALGGGFGALFEGAGPVIAAAKERAGALGKAINKVYGGAEKEAIGASEKVVDVPGLEKAGIHGMTFDDMAAKVANAKYADDALDLPAHKELLEATELVPMEYGITPAQADSVKSQEHRIIYQSLRDIGGKPGQTINQFETLQRKELTAKAKTAIKNIAPDKEIISDATKGGEIFNKYVEQQYQEEKKLLTPAFESFKLTTLDGTQDHLPGIINKITDAVPGVSKMIEVTSDGIKLLKYSDTGGSIPRPVYNAVKDVVEFFQGKNKPKTVRDLLDIRKVMDQHVDVLAQGQANGLVRNLKSAMMDYIQDTANNPEIRETLKRYALNEQQRAVIEKVLKGSVGAQDLGIVKSGEVASIGDRMLKSVEVVNALKTILPKDKFNHVLANRLAEAAANATKDGAYSPAKFFSFLDKNKNELNAAFSDNPEMLRYIKAINTIDRVVPNAAPGNPSGTAKTIIKYIENIHGPISAAVQIGKFTKDKALESFHNKVALENLNLALQGKSADFTIKEQISKAIQKTTEKMDSGVKSIFNSNTGNAIKGAAIPPVMDHYDKNVKKIQELGNDPTSMLDHLDKTSKSLYSSMPHVTNGLNQAMIKSVQFLNAKLPKPNSELPFSAKWEPTKSQKDKFNRYYAAVNDPLIALKQIKNGSLSNETMEALREVHPELLAEMQQKIMSELNPKKKNLNYATQIALSKFMGHPMNNSMLPQVVASNQQSFMMQAQQEQQSSGGVGKSTLGGLKNLDASGRTKTMTMRSDDQS